MEEVVAPRYLAYLRVFFSLILCVAAAFYVHKSIHWPVMWDTSIMHYVNFLMSRGLAPYRDIVDINLPGAYMVEGWAMHIFGPGDLAWRLYDFTLLGILTTSLIVIALPYDWFAGLFAGVEFLLIHAREGALNAGQREEAMIMLVITGYALLFTAMRLRSPVLLLPFGLCLGLAASLKPTAAPFALLILFLAAVALRKRSIAIKPYLGYGLLGLVLVLLLNLEFLYRYHAFGAFFEISKSLLTYYASIGNFSILWLLHTLLTPLYLLLICATVFLTFINRAQNEWENWERFMLILGLCFGVFSYLAQRKPFDHHAYSFLVFLLFWSSLEITKAWKKRGWVQVACIAYFAVVVLFFVPRTVHRMDLSPSLSTQQDLLEADLTQLGGANLQHQVQCFDMVSSCFGALYHLRLLPYTNFMGDYMFFGPLNNQPPPYYRDMMWTDIQKNPPKIIVLTSASLWAAPSLHKIYLWPQFADYLNSAYTLAVDRPTQNSAMYDYRIYILKDKSNPAQPKAHVPSATRN